MRRLRICENHNSLTPTQEISYCTYGASFKIHSQHVESFCTGSVHMKPRHASYPSGAGLVSSQWFHNYYFLFRRIVQRAEFSRRKKHDDNKDVDSINDMNNYFNKKAERAFGK